MTVSKTKAKLVDVARQLFAKMGVENTTMNDIALASKKGRRTLYTYFKSKDEIYLAVVESELDILSDMMKRVADKNISPDDKLLELIYTRLDAVKEVVYRNGTQMCIRDRNDSHQRIQGAISIPKGESGIIRFLRVCVNHIIHPPILTIDITIQCRSDHGMIVCGIKHTFGSLIV